MKRFDSNKLNNKVNYTEKLNGKEYIVGVDLANGSDATILAKGKDYHMNINHMSKVTQYED